MRKRHLMIGVLLLVFALSTVSFAQVHKNQINIGMKVGYWVGLALSFGGEYLFYEIPKIGGVVGAGLEMAYSSETITIWGDWKWKYTYIPFMAFGSFHYPIPSIPKLVPYAKVGLGYVYTAAKETGTADPLWGAYESKSSYVDFFTQLGIRYAVLPMLWVTASVGYPLYIGVGADFTINL